MARETLFDNRYRYDHIYPRGRSGEALRAYDTQRGDRPVVIKRPAPQDAPPIRAGQEVSIRAERRALQQMAGHPVLTALLDEGTFRVGGQSHLYIVMERAEGVMLEEEVLELARRQARVPELETLTIVDRLLDLLIEAHQHDIVYNDVDAKHLFWDRDTYSLKLIDWGNAVFLEGDTVTPQGVSRQSDVYQVGELLYFVLTGGQRLVVNGDSVDFGEHASRLPMRLQAIIQRAVHPILEQRYPDAAVLREELAQYALPFHRDRTSQLERIERRLQRDCSQRELERLRQDLTVIVQRDPGYPSAREIDGLLTQNLNRLAVLADLDAVRIYLESGNWVRATGLLEEVVAHAVDNERVRGQLLLETARLANESGLTPPPVGLTEVVDALYADRYQEAARLLLTSSEDREAGRDMQWLLAERIHVLVADVVVLRPHLLRLQQTLDASDRMVDWREARKRLAAIEELLGNVSAGTLAEVLGGYQEAAAQLSGLAEALEQSSRDTDSPHSVAARSARQAAGASQAVCIQLQTVQTQATASPDAAHAALMEAMLLDPVNPIFDRFEGILSSLHRLQDRIAAYRPHADGADLADWFQEAASALQPYLAQLGDPRIGMLIGSLEGADRDWSAFQNAMVAGNREAAVKSVQRVADSVRRLNPELAVWLTNVRDVVQRARYVQRHALHLGFGRAMADGWMAWDRGSGIEAERLGKQALEEIATDAEAEAADRLIRLGKLLRTWKEGNGEGNPDLTTQLDGALLAMLTPEEDRFWQEFTKQMSSPEAYLESMDTGLVAHFEATSTAAQRILFFHFVLRGVLEMYSGQPDDADFWRQAAVRALPNSEQHIAYMALTNVIRDRHAIDALVQQIENVETAEAASAVRKRVENSPFQLVLKPVLSTLRFVDEGLDAWRKGDFPTAGRAFEQGLGSLDVGEQLAHIELGRFKGWLANLNQAVAEVHVTRQRIAEAATSDADPPDSRIEGWHAQIVESTGRLLGDKCTATFEDWQDTYQHMRQLYADSTRRRSRKLRDIDETLNRARQIDAHPAYALYQHWRETVESQPEYPAPPTDEPIPQYTDEIHPAWRESGGGKRARRGVRWRAILAATLVLVVVGIIGALVLFGGPGEGGDQIAVTWETSTPTLEGAVVAVQTETAQAVALAEATATAVPTTLDPTVTPTVAPTDTPPIATTAVPTETPTEVIVASSPTPLVVPTATPILPTATAMQSVTLPAVTDPIQGRQNVLLALEQGGQAFPWPETWFKPGELGGNWLLGVNEVNGGDDLLQIVLPADLLAQFFGPEAAARLRRIEVTLTLRDYDPSLVANEMIYFGLGLQGADESRVAAQALLIRPDAMNVGARVGNEFRARTTLPINNATVTFALERYDDGTVGLFLGDDSLGAPRFLTAPNAPVTPFLFVQNGGMVISVTDLVAQFE